MCVCVCACVCVCVHMYMYISCLFCVSGTYYYYYPIASPITGSTPDCNGKECIGQASIAGTPHYTCCCRDDLCNFNITINIPDVSTTLSAVTTVLTMPLPSTSGIVHVQCNIRFCYTSV